MAKGLIFLPDIASDCDHQIASKHCVLGTDDLAPDRMIECSGGPFIMALELNFKTKFRERLS